MNGKRKKKRLHHGIFHLFHVGKDVFAIEYAFPVIHVLLRCHASYCLE